MGADDTKWLFQVPTTDEEAVKALLWGKDPLIGSCAVGIYRCRREGQGMSVLNAYEVALMAILRPGVRS